MTSSAFGEHSENSVSTNSMVEGGAAHLGNRGESMERKTGDEL